MTEEAGFQAYLMDHPGDLTARLAYVDWLEEQGRSAQARYLRTIRAEKFARRIHRYKTNDQRCDPFTGTRIKIPDVILGFIEYYRKNPAWGALHVALDDGNVRDSDVAECEENLLYRRTFPDGGGVTLYLILQNMTVTQRGKLAYLCHQFLHINRFGAYQSRPVLEGTVAVRVARYDDFVARCKRRVKLDQRWAHGDQRDYEQPGW